MNIISWTNFCQSNYVQLQFTIAVQLMDIPWQQFLLNFTYMFYNLSMLSSWLEKFGDKYKVSYDCGGTQGNFFPLQYLFFYFILFYFILFVFVSNNVRKCFTIYPWCVFCFFLFLLATMGKASRYALNALQITTIQQFHTYSNI